MSDSEPLNTSIIQVLISFKNECVIIRDLSSFMLKIDFDARGASMNVYSKHPIACNDSRHASAWRYHVHCRHEEMGSLGIICIICHQVLRHPVEHGSSSTGKHLKAKAHIAMLNKLTVSEVTELTSSTVDERALPIMMMQGTRGITIVK